MEKTEDEVLKYKIENTLNEQVRSLSFLPAGITNHNYLVNEEWIVKIKEPKLACFASLLMEEQVANGLYQKLHTPLHHFYSDLIKVDYLPNTERLTKSNFLKMAPHLVSVLHEMHALAIDHVHDFDMFGRYFFYKKHVDGLASLPEEEKIVEQAKFFFDQSHKVICHNDLVNGNILIQGAKLYLIDFEYAGLNDPDFDVVSFLSENDFVDEEVEKVFLSEYYKHDSVPTEKLKAYTRFADLLWYYWALFAYKQTKRAIFIEIALSKKSHYLN